MLQGARRRKPWEADTGWALLDGFSAIARPCCTAQQAPAVRRIPIADGPLDAPVPLRWGEPRARPHVNVPRPPPSVRGAGQAYTQLVQIENVGVEEEEAEPPAAASKDEEEDEGDAGMDVQAKLSMMRSVSMRRSVSRLPSKERPMAMRRSVAAWRQAYHETAIEKQKTGVTIDRLLVENKPTSLKREATRVFHDIEGEEHHGLEYDIPEDSYGAAVLAIVQELPNCGGGVLSSIRSSFALIVLALNIVVQWGILVFIDDHVVRPALQNLEETSKDYYEKVWPLGEFQQQLWEGYQGKIRLCSLGASSRFFYNCVLFIWVTRVFGEFRFTYYLTRTTVRMPRSPDVASQMVVTSCQRICIVALMMKTKLLLILVVCIPKAVISTYLLTLGCQWLTASTSFEELVLNTVAMDFVLHIDELLYKAFMPLQYRWDVAEINFFTVPENGSGAEDEETWWSIIESYGGAVFYLLAALCFTVCFQVMLPVDIFEWQAQCGGVVESLYGMLCPEWGWSPTVMECYPFGVNSTVDFLSQQTVRTVLQRTNSAT